MAKIRSLFASQTAGVVSGIVSAILALFGAFLLGLKSKSVFDRRKVLEPVEGPQIESPSSPDSIVLEREVEKGPYSLSEAITEVKDDTVELLHDFIEDVKPRLRGWLHLWSIPPILIGGFILLILAPTTISRLASSFFILGALLTFGVSAIYHRGNGVWSRDIHLRFKKLDHCNIFVLIGACSSGFGLLLLDGTKELVFLTMIWIGVIIGILFKIFWLSAPRLIGVALYIALGWTPIIFVKDFWEGASEVGHEYLIIGLILAGGILYMFGALIYGFKLFNGNPLIWGFHENFHLFTLLAFTCHYIAISTIAYSTPVS